MRTLDRSRGKTRKERSAGGGENDGHPYAKAHMRGYILGAMRDGVRATETGVLVSETDDRIRLTSNGLRMEIIKAEVDRRKFKEII